MPPGLEGRRRLLRAAAPAAVAAALDTARDGRAGLPGGHDARAARAPSPWLRGRLVGHGRPQPAAHSPQLPGGGCQREGPLLVRSSPSRWEPNCCLSSWQCRTQVLSDGGFHVLSVDYRGFGDSTGKPTEEGLTTDAIRVYEWTKARSGITPVCLWGHSLGTGVATNAAKVLEEKGCPVDAIVLEAPFTNMWVASINYPLLKIYRNVPGFLRTFMDAMRKDKIVFPNDENVKFLSSPLLILHGEDDRTVPLEYGKKLYEIAHNAYRNKERVKMVIFPPGFQHNLLCKSPTLLITVRDFLSKQWS
nr:protein ABHD12B isoform X2 [Chlorocebus sabaeus]